VAKLNTMNRNQSEIAYQFLRQKLLNRELQPGNRVRYGPLGVEIGMSATPVREAIGRLASEGFVDLVPQSGAIVRRPTRADAIEVFEMREAIEPYAAAKASQLVGVLQLKALQGTIDTMRLIRDKVTSQKSVSKRHAAQFDTADLDFHLTILQATDNRRMQKVVSDYHVLTEIIGTDRHAYNAEILEMTMEDHSAVLDCLKLRDADATRSAMLTHIRNSRQLTLNGL
jgi:DNA-binding GntR family transcriptional regulator